MRNLRRLDRQANVAIAVAGVDEYLAGWIEEHPTGVRPFAEILLKQSFPPRIAAEVDLDDCEVGLEEAADVRIRKIGFEPAARGTVGAAKKDKERLAAPPGQVQTGGKE